MKMFATHIVSTLEELKQGGVKELTFESPPPPKCEDHEELKKIFCFDCNKLHYQPDLDNLTKSDNLKEHNEVPTDVHHPSSENGSFDPYTAQSLVSELNNQVMMSQALAAEAKFIVQQATFEVQDQPLPPEDEARVMQDLPQNITLETIVSQDTTEQVMKS